MQAQSNRIRLGAAALGISALIFLIVQLLSLLYAPVILRPPPRYSIGEVTVNVVGLTVDLTHSIVSSVPYEGLFIYALVLLGFGVIALYSYMANSRAERWAFAGMILSLAGSGLLLPFIGLRTFAYSVPLSLYIQPIPENQAAAMLVIRDLTSVPTFLTRELGTLFLALGSIALGVALWRSGTLPKWAALPYALGFTFFTYSLSPELPQIVRALDGLLIGIGGLWIGASLWRQTSAPRG